MPKLSYVSPFLVVPHWLTPKWFWTFHAWRHQHYVLEVLSIILENSLAASCWIIACVINFISGLRGLGGDYVEDLGWLSNRDVARVRTYINSEVEKPSRSYSRFSNSRFLMQCLIKFLNDDETYTSSNNCYIATFTMFHCGMHDITLCYSLSLERCNFHYMTFKNCPEVRSKIFS